MIITVTPNPSIDRTVKLSNPLVRGAVQRAQSASTEPGGKGINVARALTLAGVDTLALLPAMDSDPILAAMDAQRVPFHHIPTAAAVRVNVAITESDGTTTKINELGAPLGTDSATALTEAILERARAAEWVVLSGSLPPGLTNDWYSHLVEQLGEYDCKTAVDTSDGPLMTLAAGFDHAAPDLIKPNADELAGLTGTTAETLEAALAQGDPEPVIRATQLLIKRGARTVLATMGSAGAVLAAGSDAWLATPAPVSPRSTVGAGDAALAGYLRADREGAEPPARLRMAVAYGSAAAALPGSAMPSPEDIDVTAVTVRSTHLDPK